MLQLISYSEERRILLKEEQLRILDFYLLFPNLLSDIKPDRQGSAMRRKLGLEENTTRYGRVANPKRLFIQLEEVHSAALQNLSSHELLARDKLELGLIVRTEVEIPADLNAHIRERNQRCNQLLKFLIENLAALPVSGKGGLKERTGMMEHKYDTN